MEVLSQEASKREMPCSLEEEEEEEEEEEAERKSKKFLTTRGSSCVDTE